jgi:membrane protein
MAIDLLSQSVRAWNRHGVPTLSAAMAFYVLMSIAPLLVIVVGLTGWILDDERVREHLIEGVSTASDPGTAALVADLVERPGLIGSNPIGGLLALLVMILASTAAFSHLRDALNRVWEVPKREEPVVRGFLRGRAVAFGLVLLVGVTVLASVVLRTTLSALGSVVERWIPVDIAVLHVMDLGLFFVLLTGVFTLVYRYVPDVRTSWRQLFIGACVTSLLVLVGIAVIGLYMARAGFGSAFGVASSAVVLAGWVYYSCMVFLLGAELTHLHAERQRGTRPLAG